MKKALPLLTLVLLVSLPLFAERVPSETAKRVAWNFLSNNGAKATQLEDLSEATGFQNLYVFTAEEGFVVMSADDCVLPVLGYSLTGSFKTEDMPENIRFWLLGYNDAIQQVIDQQLQASPETSQQWFELWEGVKTAKATPVVGPLIQTQWDQGNPYNLYCPSGTVTGCVATAMAQVMNYWQYPVHGIGSQAYIPEDHPEYGTQSCDFNNTFYNWANMANTYSGSSSTVQKQAVATLMYHCGVSVEMNYGPGSTGGSGASTENVAIALKTCFNYSSDIQYLDRDDYTETEWINLLKADLNQNRPIQYSGSGSGGGHSFVCDGYDTDNYFHFNWGWSGYCDAYYYINNLNPGPGGIGSGSNGIYNNQQGAVFGVQPSGCTLAAPVLTYTQSERNVTLNWAAVSGATSYSVFCNNNKIGNTNTTSFTTTAPFGDAAYYVRCVDSSGEMSLSSNAITTTVDYPNPSIDDLEVTLSGTTATLHWTTPDWCFPETESSILTYGNGVGGYYLGYGGTAHLYWGHRYLPSDLSGTTGKAIFRVSFYVRDPGNYVLYIYKGTKTSGSYSIPSTLLKSKSISPTKIGWFSIDLDAPITIDPSKDLWVMIYDPEYKPYPAGYGSFSAHDRGGYYSTNINSWTSTFSDGAFLIRTYLTDGTYTYNLYRDGVELAHSISTTSYSTSIFNNRTNQFVVKTNYYGGETPSNLVGYAKGNATATSLKLAENDIMTVTGNAILTVTGTASNNNPEHLVLENGAQLIHNSNGVKATVKKDLSAYTSDDNGWYFIASPVTENVTPTAENGLLNGNYDLYYYDEPSQNWTNHKEASFNLTHKQGYLYASDAATTLQFSGTLKASNSPVNITGLSHSASTLNGFNLVGNPFVCNATINQDCYVIDGGNVVLASGTKTFAPGEGAFVKAVGNNYTVTFTKTTAGKSDSMDYFDLVVAQGEAQLDRARVRLGHGIGMEKINLDNTNSQLSLSQNGTEFAVAYAADQTEIPVNFKAAQNGVYTLTVSATANCLRSTANYFHLIDNLTGADTDLLQTPSYTFEANTTDTESRFKLVLSVNDEDRLNKNNKKQ